MSTLSQLAAFDLVLKAEEMQKHIQGREPRCIFKRRGPHITVKLYFDAEHKQTADNDGDDDMEDDDVAYAKK